MIPGLVPPASSLALLDALARLIESDPKELAKARSLTDCDRDDAIAGALGALIETLAGDPRAVEKRDVADRARAWLQAFRQHLADRRRFVTMAHETAADVRERYGLDVTPDDVLTSSFCEAVAAISDEEVERDKARAEEERRMRAELFNNDYEREQQAWDNGTHPKNRAAPA